MPKGYSRNICFGGFILDIISSSSALFSVYVFMISEGEGFIVDIPRFSYFISFCASPIARSQHSARCFKLASVSAFFMKRFISGSNNFVSVIIWLLHVLHNPKLFTDKNNPLLLHSLQVAILFSLFILALVTIYKVDQEKQDKQHDYCATCVS